MLVGEQHVPFPRAAPSPIVDAVRERVSQGLLTSPDRGESRLLPPSLKLGSSSFPSVSHTVPSSHGMPLLPPLARMFLLLAVDAYYCYMPL